MEARNYKPRTYTHGARVAEERFTVIKTANGILFDIQHH